VLLTRRQRGGRNLAESGSSECAADGGAKQKSLHEKGA
jgi:hypothetical protein